MSWQVAFVVVRLLLDAAWDALLNPAGSHLDRFGRRKPLLACRNRAVGCLLLLPVVGLAGCGGKIVAGPAPPTTTLSATQNPLVAQYSVTVSRQASVWVEFGKDTLYGRQTSLVDTGPGGGTVNILVAGMRPSASYHMRAHVRGPGNTEWTDEDQSFTTGELPAGLTVPPITVSRPLGDANQSGVELLNLFSPGTNLLEAAALDLDGNVIWYYDVGGTLGNQPYPIKLLANGHMLVNVWDPFNNTGGLREIDLAGNIIRELSFDELRERLNAKGYSTSVSILHHDLCPLPNGHLIVLGNVTKPFTDLPGYPGTTDVLGDVLIDLDSSWTPVWFWSSFDHLDVNRHLMGLPDWTHSNAVLYTADGDLLLSVRHQSWILKIDYANGKGTGNILWRLGEDGDFSMEGGDSSQWFYAQHFPNILNEQGQQLRLAVFDNGNERIVDQNGDTCDPSGPTLCYTRGAIFQVDEAHKTATLSWQYTPGFYSPWGGSIVSLDGGNMELDMTQPFVPSLASRVVEVTAASTPQIVWQLDLANTAAYRAYRIPSLYPGVTWR